MMLNTASLSRKTPKCYLLFVKILLNPYLELMKSRFHRLSSLVCMLVGMKWLERQNFIPLKIYPPFSPWS